MGHQSTSEEKAPSGGEWTQLVSTHGNINSDALYNSFHVNTTKQSGTSMKEIS